MIIDLSCPIELRGYELLHDDNGNALAYIRMFNLANETIIRYKATANWFEAVTQRNMTSQLEVDQCAIPARRDFKLTITAPKFPEADHVELYFSCIEFESGNVFESRDGALVNIGEQPMLEGAEMDALKALAGEDAVQYPQVQSEFWRCVCGRINTQQADVCWRCERPRNDVLKYMNAKAVRKGNRDFRRAKARACVIKRHDSLRDKAMKGLLVALILIFMAILGFELGRGGMTGERPEQSTDAPTWITPDLSENV